jgi:uncharacterized protein
MRNLRVIGKVPSHTGVLILNGENDTQTPVQQALLLKQRLTEVKHPDHTMVTYPNLGHEFHPSSRWFTKKWTYTRICSAKYIWFG